MPFPPRDSQTRIKHGILREYVGAWSGIIANGLRGAARQANVLGRPFQLPLIYVDGFGGCGRYERDSDQLASTEPVWGSPIIGMRALEASVARFDYPIQLSGIVVEENPANFEELVATMQEAVLRTPLGVRERVADAVRGEVTLVEGDFRDHVTDLVRWLRDSFALVLVDPYGTGMPMEALKPLLSRSRTDAIILFPFLDIDRKGGSAKKPVEERTPHDQGNVTRVTNVFGTEQWIAIACDPTLTMADREERYATLYFDQLRALYPELIVKNIALRLSASDRTGYHLFLTTTDADGAMRMNDILRSAEFQEHFTIWRDEVERQRRREEESAQESMFGDLGLAFGSPAPAVEPLQVDMKMVEGAILALCPHNTDLTPKQFYGCMANTPYRSTEIDKALRALRNNKRAQFTGLNRTDKIRILG